MALPGTSRRENRPTNGSQCSMRSSRLWLIRRRCARRLKKSSNRSASVSTGRGRDLGEGDTLVCRNLVPEVQAAAPGQEIRPGGWRSEKVFPDACGLRSGLASGCPRAPPAAEAAARIGTSMRPLAPSWWEAVIGIVEFFSQSGNRSHFGAAGERIRGKISPFMYKRAEEAVRQAEAKFRGTTKCGGGIFQTTPDGRGGRQPRAGPDPRLRLTAELIGAVTNIGPSCASIPDPGGAPAKLEAQGSVRSSKTVSIADGFDHLTSVSAHVRNSQGRVPWGTSRDITGRKKRGATGDAGPRWKLRRNDLHHRFAESFICRPHSARLRLHRAEILGQTRISAAEQRFGLPTRSSSSRPGAGAAK